MTARELLELLLQNVTGIETEQKSMKQELQDVKSQMNSRFDTADTKMSIIQTDVTEIKESVHRLDADQPEDVIGLLI